MPRGIRTRYTGLSSQEHQSTSKQANPSCLGSPIVCRRQCSNIWWSSGTDVSAARICCSSGSIHRSNPRQFMICVQVPDDIATPRSSGLITLFREWCARPIDLPGTYYLQVVQWLYKDNQLATGRFAALG